VLRGIGRQAKIVIMKKLLCALLIPSLFSFLACQAQEAPNTEQAAAIQAALQKVDPAIAAGHFDAVLADLNGDAHPDALALMNGKSGYCGTGGCTLFVLQGTDDGFTKIGTVGVVHRPIYLRGTSHHGLRDLLVRVRGGGATPGFVGLEFDGKSYPPGPGNATATVESTDKVLFADASTSAFDQTLHWFGISFHVTSPNTNGSNSVTITPAGLKKDNSPVTANIDGVVTGAEVADLNIDSSPEVYVYVRATDDSNIGSLVAYAANKKKSLSQIYLPDLAENKKNAIGYRGGDEFAVVESTLVRRFPIYPEDMSIATPTGRTRQLQYKLKAGEAGWILRLDKSLEY
jgi:hypothetical protein